MLKLLKSNNVRTGYLYFYIHFIVEVVCFFYLSRVTNNSSFIWLIPFIYDGLAFVPQSIIGYISDKSSFLSLILKLEITNKKIILNFIVKSQIIL